MRHDPNLFDPADDEAEARADAKAEDDVRKGRLISHDAVRKWLESWISGKPIARPRVGDRIAEYRLD